jgi:hypothetical protein
MSRRSLSLREDRDAQQRRVEELDVEVDRLKGA